MNLYDAFMYPLEAKFLQSMRKEIIPYAHGDVLELGAGTGVNFPYYDKDKVKTLSILDKEVNNAAVKRAPENATFFEADATLLPFDDASFDVVTETLLLCSVDDESKVLNEILRVLKPDGIFLHIDHQLPETNKLKKFFRAAAPTWHCFTKSCQIDKRFKPMIDNASFETVKEFSRFNGVFYGGISRKAK